jgi:NAD-dependent deacetylase
LHERAGSSSILHLHGIITQAKSTYDESLIYEIKGDEILMGDRCEFGSQLRPNIVWFGEAVPNIEPAIKLVEDADLMLVIGTSLQVYPAAGLIHYVPEHVPKFIIDKKIPPTGNIKNVQLIEKSATEGIDIILREFLSN